VLCAGAAEAGREVLAPGPSTAATPPARQPPARAAAVEVALDRPLAHFSPAQAIGAGLDGHSRGETAQIYTPSNLRAMAAAGLGAVSYRLRTELGVQAWHIDPAGSWSNPTHSDGYWTTAGRPARGPAPLVSWGYGLPRRGDTVDQANDSGYSRLDDGSLQSFWKSNPYLDSYFTHEPDALHPQWVLIDLGRARAIDALRIAWAAPYATRFQVQRYVGGPDAVALAPGHWRDFPRGVLGGRPGGQTLRLAGAPVSTRFVRILMSAGSHTALAGSRDVRDRLGYAIREVYVGTLTSGGRFSDALTHRPDKGQSRIYASSTDPWHSASNLDPGYEQPSFQTVLRSGLTHGLPVLVPVGVLYGTPENAVAELRYLQALHLPLRGVELGEEPDGQLISPEDYGALYVRFARAIHRAFPRLALGGPGFATSLPDWAYWPDAHGDRSWTRRFVKYLKTRRAMGLLDFFSFEWYPFDNVCAPPGPQLARASRLLSGVLALQRREGIPRRLPVYITEYGYSAYAGQEGVDMPGALLNADTVGTLLADGGEASTGGGGSGGGGSGGGGDAAYLYGYEPNVPIRESGLCDTWGNLMLLRADPSGGAPWPLASFWETQMLTHEWTSPKDRIDTLYATRFKVGAGGGAGNRPDVGVGNGARDGAGNELVRAYAVRRPDGRLALLLLNLSPSRPYRVTVRVRLGAHLERLTGPLREWQLSSANYTWRPAGPTGAPSLDLPPVHSTSRNGRSPVLLPPYSITVLRSAHG
jgi:hypothetical protein